MAREKKSEETTRDDVNQGDVRATVVNDPNPRVSNPQTYDGGDHLPADGGLTQNSVVDNTAEGAPEPQPTLVPAPQPMIEVQPKKYDQLKGARVRLNEKAYINDVLYEEGAVIDSYSGPAAPHLVEIDDKGNEVKK